MIRWLRRRRPRSAPPTCDTLVRMRDDTGPISAWRDVRLACYDGGWWRFAPEQGPVTMLISGQPTHYELAGFAVGVMELDTEVDWAAFGDQAAKRSALFTLTEVGVLIERTAPHVPTPGDGGTV